MNNILEICIPTFNRREKVLQTVKFIIEERTRANAEISIHIKDNASSDGTYLALLEHFSDVPNLKVTQNTTNVGLVKNLLFLIDESKGKYTWLVGDDDILHEGIVKEVISACNTNPNMIFINHNAFYDNGNIAFESAFPIKKNLDLLDVFSFSFTSVMFITASVYNTKVIKEITKLQLENKSPARLSAPLYWALKAGSFEKLYVLDKILITNIWGDISWKNEKYKVAILNVPTELLKCSLLKYPKLKVLKSLTRYFWNYSIKFFKKLFI